MVQGLGFYAFVPEGAGSISGQKPKIPQVVRPQKILKIIFYIIMLQPLFVDL